MAHQVLARKWRPKQFHELVGQPVVVQALTNALSRNQLHQAYLFTGTRGIGKTTLARLLAKALNCKEGVSANFCGECEACCAIDAGHYPDVLEVDAASKTKVEDTRILLDNVQYLPTSGRYKIYLIDEVHMLSGHSFNALLKTLEEPPAHVKFILATTEPEKLPATILSRCLQFHLNSVSVELIKEQLAKIVEAESIPYESEALQVLATAAKGSLRDGLTLLEQATGFAEEKLTKALMRQMLGFAQPDLLFALLDHVFMQNAAKALETIALLASKSIAFESIIGSLLEYLHYLAIIQHVEHAYSEESLEGYQALVGLSQKACKEQVQLFYDILVKTQSSLPYLPEAKIGLEMACLRMIAFYPIFPEAKQAQPMSVVPEQKPELAQEKASVPAHHMPAKKTTTLDWAKTLPALKLSGLAKSFAQHCTVQSFDGKTLTLMLDEVQKPLLTQRHEQAVVSAMGEYLGKPIKCVVNIGHNEKPTPAKQVQQAKEKKQATIENNLQKDEDLQSLLGAFNAKVQSVKAVDD